MRNFNPVTANRYQTKKSAGSFLQYLRNLDIFKSGRMHMKEPFPMKGYVRRIVDFYYDQCKRRYYICEFFLKKLH